MIVLKPLLYILCFFFYTNGVGSVYSMDMLDKGVINVLGGTEQDEARFRHSDQNSAQFKTYGLFFSGICHLIFLDCG